VKQLDLDKFTYVVAMDKSVATNLKKLCSRDIIVWNISDPWDDEPIAYKRCALRILEELLKPPFTLVIQRS
jgi:protein-tyrosine-phosphatase